MSKKNWLTTVAGVVLFVVAFGLTALVVSGGSDDTEAAAESTPTETTATPPAEPQRYISVTELRDAAVEAGYVCKRWRQKNVVDLAAESGNCSDADVFATYASEGDLQKQLDVWRNVHELFEEVDMEPDPILVGPNWTINGQQSVEVAEALRGTVSR